MLRRLFFSFLLICCLFPVAPAFALIDPLSVTNNRYGIHVFSPDEIFTAAKLVNSSGGDWGYLTLPIRADERDFDKWFTFFENCRRLHIIPIIRLATYVDGNRWVAPTANDLVDYANFLNAMPWPTKNRYVILFNEPNHAAEWGGQVSPSEYATLLLEARRIFKNRSEDFFLLSAGLDMSAPNTSTSLDALTYYRRMFTAQPDWVRAIDGLSVHAYPNPAFSASPLTTNRYGIRSFEYELSLLKQLGAPDLPIFITETGSTWRSGFYPTAFNSVWTSPRIVAITPFVLFAATGDFQPFSLLDPAHNPLPSYNEIFSLTKIAGSPLLAEIKTLPVSSIASFSSPKTSPPPTRSLWDMFRSLFKRSTTPTLTLGNHTLNVEIADSQSEVTHGLSGRTSLPENTGMLFVFPRPTFMSFWMNEMKFSLDMVWIRSGKIFQIDENIPPPSETNNVPRLVNPSSSFDYVLEVPGGFTRKNNINIGDTAVLNSP